MDTTEEKKTRSRRPDRGDSDGLALPGLSFPGIFEDFIRPFDGLMAPILSGSRPLWAELGAKEPSVDFQDRGDHYVLTAELPGFDRKDVEVDVSSKGLELRAERSSEKETNGKGASQRQADRSSYRRYLALPEEVRSEKVEGTMKNGVLELRLPKREPKAGERPTRVDLR